MRSQKEKDLCDEIRRFINPLNFEQCPTNIFRDKVQQHIHATVRLALISNDCFCRYDGELVNRLLFYSGEAGAGCGCGSVRTKYFRSHGIEWDSMCTSHDSSRRANVNVNCIETKHRDSALEILIDALVNPTIVPPCFNYVIVQGMLSVCVEVFSSASSALGMQLNHSDSPSFGIVKNAMLYLLQLRPSAMISTRIKRFVFRQVMCNLSFDQNASSNIPTLIQSTLNDYNVNRTLTILSIVHDLSSMKTSKDRKGLAVRIANANQLRVDVVMFPAILLLKEIDTIDLFLLRQHQPDTCTPKRESVLCTKCRDRLFPEEEHKRKRIKTSSLRDLHGEASEDEKKRTTSFGCSRYSYSQGRSNERPIVLPWKKMMNATVNDESVATCEICSRSNTTGKYKYTSSRDITCLPFRWVKFRASLMEIVMKSLHLSLLDTVRSRKLALSIFRMTMRHHQHPSTRLCSIIAANCAGIEHGFMAYLQLILKVLKKSVNMNPDSNGRESSQHYSLRNVMGWVHLYREILNECAVFDDPGLCWRGMKPLFDLVLSLNDKTKIGSNADADGQRTNIGREILLSIGFILVERGCCITKAHASTNVQLAFNSYVLRFAEEFGSADKWLDSKMSTLQKGRIITALQTLGILSFFDSLGAESAFIEDGIDNLWIYDESLSVKAAYFRVGPIVHDQKLFSEKNSFEIEENAITTRNHREREDSTTGEPIMNYINDDITRVIFSFLGYKLLVRATSTCKLWNSIGNDNVFWEPHYKKRFKPIFLEEMIPRSTNVTTKQDFISKHCRREVINWRLVFNNMRNIDKTLCLKVSKSGWKHRHCRVFGCTTVIRRKEDETKHAKLHQKDIQKKIAVIERAEKRRMAKLEKEALEVERQFIKYAMSECESEAKSS